MYKCAGGIDVYCAHFNAAAVYSRGMGGEFSPLAAPDLVQFYHVRSTRAIQFVVFASPNDSLLSKPIVEHLFDSVKALVVVIPAAIFSPTNSQLSATGIDRIQIVGLATFTKYLPLFEFVHWIIQVQSAASVFNNGGGVGGINNVSRKRQYSKNGNFNATTTTSSINSIQVRLLNQFNYTTNNINHHHHQTDGDNALIAKLPNVNLLLCPFKNSRIVCSDYRYNYLAVVISQWIARRKNTIRHCRRQQS